MNMPQRRPNQGSDENHVPAAGRARQPQEFANLPNMDPVVWVTFDRKAVGGTAQGK
jgi:hypothetical protein